MKRMTLLEPYEIRIIMLSLAEIKEAIDKNDNKKVLNKVKKIEKIFEE